MEHGSRRSSLAGGSDQMEAAHGCALHVAPSSRVRFLQTSIVVEGLLRLLSRSEDKPWLNWLSARCVHS